MRKSISLICLVSFISTCSLGLANDPETYGIEEVLNLDLNDSNSFEIVRKITIARTKVEEKKKACTFKNYSVERRKRCDELTDQLRKDLSVKKYYPEESRADKSRIIKKAGYGTWIHKDRISLILSRLNKDELNAFKEKAEATLHAYGCILAREPESRTIDPKYDSLRKNYLYSKPLYEKLGIRFSKNLSPYVINALSKGVPLCSEHKQDIQDVYQCSTEGDHFQLGSDPEMALQGSYIKDLTESVTFNLKNASRYFKQGHCHDTVEQAPLEYGLLGYFKRFIGLNKAPEKTLVTLSKSNQVYVNEGEVTFEDGTSALKLRSPSGSFSYQTAAATENYPHEQVLTKFPNENHLGSVDLKLLDDSIFDSISNYFYPKSVSLLFSLKLMKDNSPLKEYKKRLSLSDFEIPRFYTRMGQKIELGHHFYNAETQSLKTVANIFQSGVIELQDRVTSEVTFETDQDLIQNYERVTLFEDRTKNSYNAIGISDLNPTTVGVFVKNSNSLVEVKNNDPLKPQFYYIKK